MCSSGVQPSLVAIGGQRLAVGWLLVAIGSWWSLGAVLKGGPSQKKKKGKLGSLRTALGFPESTAGPRPNRITHHSNTWDVEEADLGHRPTAAPTIHQKRPKLRPLGHAWRPWPWLRPLFWRAVPNVNWGPQRPCLTHPRRAPRAQKAQRSPPAAGCPRICWQQRQGSEAQGHRGRGWKVLVARGKWQSAGQLLSLHEIRCTGTCG